jgi:hypothetical protein
MILRRCRGYSIQDLRGCKSDPIPEWIEEEIKSDVFSAIYNMIKIKAVRRENGNLDVYACLDVAPVKDDDV